MDVRSEGIEKFAMVEDSEMGTLSLLSGRNFGSLIRLEG